MGSTQQETQALTQAQALNPARSFKPPMEIVNRIDCRLEVKFSAEDKSKRAAAEAE
jgi:hypothetical protein